MNVTRMSICCVFFWLQSFLLRADEYLIPSVVRPTEYMPPFNTALVRQEQEATAKESLKKIEHIVQSVTKEHDGLPNKKGRRLLVGGVEGAPQADKESLLRLSGVYNDEELVHKKITLNIKKMSVKKAIELINKLSDMSFVVDPNVTGMVDEVQASDVPLSVALQVMLNSAQPRLGIVKTFGVWRVMLYPLALELLKAKEQEVRDLDCASASHTVLHAKWDDRFKTRIERLWDGVVGDMKGKPGFFIVFDDSSKKIFFKGRSHHIEDFTHMLQEIDIEAPQIRLDVRVVIADKSFEETLGFQYSGRYDRAMATRHFEFASLGAKQTPVSDITSGTNPTVSTPFGSLTDWSLNLIPGWKAADTMLSNAKQSGMFSIPFIFRNADYTKLLNLTLNAAENRHEIKTILKPSLLVNSDETAEILVGESMPLQVQVAETIGSNMTNVTTTQFKDIGIKITVKPVVSADSTSVFLDIFLENSLLRIPTQPITWQQDGREQQIGYTIQTAHSKNRVLLRSGQTTLISGLITNSARKSNSGVPYLQDIPVLGYLFRGSKKMIEDKQMLIFITPVVV